MCYKADLYLYVGHHHILPSLPFTACEPSGCEVIVEIKISYCCRSSALISIPTAESIQNFYRHHKTKLNALKLLLACSGFQQSSCFVISFQFRQSSQKVRNCSRVQKFVTYLYSSQFLSKFQSCFSEER